MSSAESAFIDALRGFATDPAARGLMDDAALLPIGGHNLVLTKDMLVEGVHYLPGDPPADVAWKLVAVNLSDLAAKGARPIAALLGLTLSEAGWDKTFAEGLRAALEAFALPLLGGDTVSSPGPRVLSLTAIGESTGPIPSRAGASPGDDLWVSGTVGDAGAGLAILRGELAGDDSLVRRYRAPRPRLEAGQALAPLVTAMMDVSDGLLIDASRLGHASNVGIALALDTIPLSTPLIAALGEDRAARLRGATAGDDYELLFTAPASTRHRLIATSERLGLPLTRIGAIEAGAGLSLTDKDGPIPLPDCLGWEHGRS
jgi:thiamine-monophosphate kinase